jgi:hypothetical protein
VGNARGVAAVAARPYVVAWAFLDFSLYNARVLLLRSSEAVCADEVGAQVLLLPVSTASTFL